MVSPMAESFPHGRCQGCGLGPALCLCAAIPRIETRTRFLILRHVLEGRRRSNSARIAARALPNSEIVERGAPGESAGLDDLDDGRTWLLYPGGAAEGPPGPPPARLVVLDGTWRQARRMFLRIHALRALPRLSIPQPAVLPDRRLRRAPEPGHLATLEAIAWAVERLEGPELAKPLHDLFAEFTHRNLRFARDPSRRTREHPAS